VINAVHSYLDEKTNTCFVVEEKTKKTILCAFISPNKNLEMLANEWLKDILDFIKNCAEYYSHEVIK